MLARGGVFGQARSFRADRPIPAGSPPPGAFTTATLGAERNLTTLFQVANPAISNFYQSNFRVDPAAPTLRQSASFKTGTAESVMGYIWTTDGWSTYNTYVWTTLGDPDTIWTNAGDLLLGGLSRGGNNNPYQTRRVVGGGAAVGPVVGATSVGIDYPHFFAHRPSGRIFVCGTHLSSNGVGLGYTDDGGLTWTKRVKSYTTAINNGFTSQGCQTDAGTILLPQSTQTTILSSGGVYAGTQQDAYILRSTDAGVTWQAIYAFSMNKPKTRVGGVIHTHDMWHHKGRVHWLQAKPVGTSGAMMPFYGYSDDDGKTFSWSTTPIPQPWAGAGAGTQQVWIGAADGVIVVHAVWIKSDLKYQFWAHYSFDGGLTWTARQTSPQGTDRYDINPRQIGDDQNDCDLVGDTAYLIWPDNSVGGASYSAYTRSLKFS